MRKGSANDAMMLEMGPPGQKIDENTFSNIYNIDIANKTSKEQNIRLEIADDKAKLEVIGGNSFDVDKTSITKREFILKMDRKNLEGPKTPLTILVFAGEELKDEVDLNFIGPGF